MSDLIQVSKAGPVATVTLNRPERMNALNLPMWQGLAEAFEALSADYSVRAVILRGAGEKAFAPGADIDEFDTVRATPAQAKEYDLVLRRALKALSDCPAPVIAMIYGPCVGGGLELACCCDLRISGKSGKFGVPINKISVVMAYPELAAIARVESGRRNPDGQGFAALGQVVFGMDTVRRIHAGDTDPALGEAYVQGQMLRQPVRLLWAREVK